MLMRVNECNERATEREKREPPPQFFFSRDDPSSTLLHASTTLQGHWLHVPTPPHRLVRIRQTFHATICYQGDHSLRYIGTKIKNEQNSLVFSSNGTREIFLFDFHRKHHETCFCNFLRQNETDSFCTISLMRFSKSCLTSLGIVAALNKLARISNYSTQR